MMKKTPMLCLFFLVCSFLASAQERTITGKISEETNKSSVAGATVTVKGAKKTVTADANGAFTISAPAGNVTLIISSIGFATKEVAVGPGDRTVDILLSMDNKQLGEVVVTALGITRQSKTLVYAAQSVSPNQLNGVRSSDNFLGSLSGKAANIQFTQGSGGLGSGANIILRGNRSIAPASGGNVANPNNALIVVDGVPINNTTFMAGNNDFGSVQSSDGASDINPDDIESMTVLPGASAAALYGSQAGNGVIVISTKKGHKGRTDVTVNSGVAFERPFALPQFQNTYGQGDAGLIAPDSSQGGGSWGAKMTGQSYIDFLYKKNTYSPQPNNVKDFFNTGLSLNNNIGVSIGGDKTQNYISYTNNYAKGIVPGNDLNRHIFSYRITGDISRKFSIDAKATYILQDINGRPRTGEENSPVFDVYQMPRSISSDEARNNYQTPGAFGVPMPANWPSTKNSIYQSPYWMTNNTFVGETRERAIGFAALKYNITPWLNIRGSANLDRTSDEIQQKYQQGTLLWNTNPGGSFSVTDVTFTNKWFDLILEGHNNLSQDLKIGYHAGTIYYDRLYNQNNASTNGLNVANKFSMSFASNPSTTQAGTEILTESVFGQANLSWRDAVFLDASLRNDWDSRLPSPYTYLYPSVGLSAILSDLIKGLPRAISFLKASANYAEVGNGGIPDVLHTTYVFNQGAGNGNIQRTLTYPIPNLKPERIKNYEFGLEARFIQDRIGFTATYYHSNDHDELVPVPVPVGTGYSSQYINAGNIENHGVEIVVNGSPVKTKNFSWDVNINFSLNRNKVIALSPQLQTFFLGGLDNRTAQPEVKVGGSFGDLYGFAWAKNAKGQFEVNADGTPLTTLGSTLSYLGNSNARELLGMTNTFRYKRFNLSFLIDGRIGGVVVSGTEMNLSYSGITSNTLRFREGGLVLGGVDASGAPVSTPINAQQFWTTASQLRYGVGQFFTYSATNFRMRELSVGYDIPLPNKNIIKSLRFSAVARNLFWIYRGSSILDIPGIGKRKMWMDPDMANGNSLFQGVEYGALPSTRTLGFNLKANF
jgi:TonB-linked SusC/RagA family outer membrane protein